MKHAWFLSVALVGLVAAAACGDDEGTNPATTAGAGGSGGQSCGFMASGGYGGFGDVCMDEASDDACVTCARGSCCTELQDCEGDDQCSCLMECFLAGCDPVGCLSICAPGGASDYTPQTSALISCAGNCDPCVE